MRAGWAFAVVIACSHGAAVPDAMTAPTIIASWSFRDCTNAVASCQTFPSGPVVTLSFMLTPVGGDPALLGGTADACAGSATLGANLASYMIEATAENTAGSGIGNGSGTVADLRACPPDCIATSTIVIRSAFCQ